MSISDQIAWIEKWEERVREYQRVSTECEKALSTLESLQLCGAASQHGCSRSYGTSHNINCQKLKAAVDKMRQTLEACKKGKLCAAPECLNLLKKSRGRIKNYIGEYCSEKCSAKVRSKRYRAQKRGESHGCGNITLPVTETTAVPISAEA